MKTLRIVTASIVFLSIAASAVAGPKRTLQPFKSERELKSYLARFTEAYERDRRRLERLMREQERLARERREREERKLQKEIEELLRSSNVAETVTVTAAATPVESSASTSLTNVQHRGIELVRQRATAVC